MDKDHDGEGTSRWAAMTEFWSLISYQVSQVNALGVEGDGLMTQHAGFLLC